MIAHSRWLVAAALAAIPAAAAAQPRSTTCLSDADRRSAGGRNVNISNSSRTTDAQAGSLRSWLLTIATDDCSVDLRVRGEPTFRRDLSDVETLPPRGFFELTEEAGRDSRRYEVRATAGGALERSYFVGGREHDMDAAGRAWLAGVLAALERRTGFAAPSRVSALLEDGGVNAVLAEIDRMQSDHVRRVYYGVLADSARLSPADVQRVLRAAGQQIDSDFELTELLRQVVKRGLVDTRSAAAFVEATTHIGSDFEHRRALSALLAEDVRPDRAVVEAMLTDAARIGSDFELASLLIAMAKAGLVTDDVRAAYFTALGSVESDFEMRRALSALLAEKSFGAASAGEILDAGVKGISSDFELAELFLAVARTYPLEGELRDTYLDAVKAIHSDFEYRRALRPITSQEAGQGPSRRRP